MSMSAPKKLLYICQALCQGFREDDFQSHENLVKIKKFGTAIENILMQSLQNYIGYEPTYLNSAFTDCIDVFWCSLQSFSSVKGLNKIGFISFYLTFHQALFGLEEYELTRIQAEKYWMNATRQNNSFNKMIFSAYIRETLDVVNSLLTTNGDINFVQALLTAMINSHSEILKLKSLSDIPCILELNPDLDLSSGWDDLESVKNVFRVKREHVAPREAYDQSALSIVNESTIEEAEVRDHKDDYFSDELLSAQSSPSKESQVSKPIISKVDSIHNSIASYCSEEMFSLSREHSSTTLASHDPPLPNKIAQSSARISASDFMFSSPATRAVDKRLSSTQNNSGNGSPSKSKDSQPKHNFTKSQSTISEPRPSLLAGSERSHSLDGQNLNSKAGEQSSNLRMYALHSDSNSIKSSASTSSSHLDRSVSHRKTSLSVDLPNLSQYDLQDDHPGTLTAHLGKLMTDEVDELDTSDPKSYDGGASSGILQSVLNYNLTAKRHDSAFSNSSLTIPDVSTPGIAGRDFEAMLFPQVKVEQMFPSISFGHSGRGFDILSLDEAVVSAWLDTVSHSIQPILDDISRPLKNYREGDDEDDDDGLDRQNTFVTVIPAVTKTESMSSILIQSLRSELRPRSLSPKIRKTGANCLSTSSLFSEYSQFVPKNASLETIRTGKSPRSYPRRNPQRSRTLPSLVALTIGQPRNLSSIRVASSNTQSKRLSLKLSGAPVAVVGGGTGGYTSHRPTFSSEGTLDVTLGVTELGVRAVSPKVLIDRLEAGDRILTEARDGCSRRTTPGPMTDELFNQDSAPGHHEPTGDDDIGGKVGARLQGKSRRKRLKPVVSQNVVDVWQTRRAVGKLGLTPDTTSRRIAEIMDRSFPTTRARKYSDLITQKKSNVACTSTGNPSSTLTGNRHKGTVKKYPKVQQDDTQPLYKITSSKLNYPSSVTPEEAPWSSQMAASQVLPIDKLDSSSTVTERRILMANEMYDSNRIRSVILSQRNVRESFESYAGSFPSRRKILNERAANKPLELCGFQTLK